jgi:hypothetical protein
LLRPIDKVLAVKGLEERLPCGAAIQKTLIALVAPIQRKSCRARAGRAGRKRLSKLHEQRGR